KREPFASAGRAVGRHGLRPGFQKGANPRTGIYCSLNRLFGGPTMESERNVGLREESEKLEGKSQKCAPTRRDFLYTTMAGAVISAIGGSRDLVASADQDAVVAEIARQHDATLQMLRDWIALPSIAAEDRNYPQGAEYMARLAREAGFNRV